MKEMTDEHEREMIIKVQKASSNKRELEELEDAEKDRISPQIKFETYINN